MANAVNGVKDSPYHLIFTVMSYNVLSQDLLQSHQYLYHKHKARALKWKRRSHVLYSEIQEANADVCIDHTHTYTHTDRLDFHLYSIYMLGNLQVAVCYGLSNR
jgi:mRNA deadenylase 3'-5' endonuclease subunit Ccr4